MRSEEEETRRGGEGGKRASKGREEEGGREEERGRGEEGGREDECRREAIVSGCRHVRNVLKGMQCTVTPL